MGMTLWMGTWTSWQQPQATLSFARQPSSAASICGIVSSPYMSHPRAWSWTLGILHQDLWATTNAKQSMPCKALECVCVYVCVCVCVSVCVSVCVFLSWHYLLEACHCKINQGQMACLGCVMLESSVDLHALAWGQDPLLEVSKLLVVSHDLCWWLHCPGQALPPQHHAIAKQARQGSGSSKRRTHLLSRMHACNNVWWLEPNSLSL